VIRPSATARDAARTSRGNERNIIPDDDRGNKDDTLAMHPYQTRQTRISRDVLIARARRTIERQRPLRAGCFRPAVKIARFAQARRFARSTEPSRFSTAAKTNSVTEYRTLRNVTRANDTRGKNTRYRYRVTNCLLKF